MPVRPPSDFPSEVLYNTSLDIIKELQRRETLVSERYQKAREKENQFKRDLKDYTKSLMITFTDQLLSGEISDEEYHAEFRVLKMINLFIEQGTIKNDPNS